MTDIRKLDERELGQALAKAREEVRDLRFKIASKQLKDIRQIRAAKKAVARLLTEQAQRRGKPATDHAITKE